MIEDPGCICGRLISFSPQRGPEASTRRSLQIFVSLAEVSGVGRGLDQVLRQRELDARAAVTVVPIAVAPRLTDCKSCRTSAIRFTSRRSSCPGHRGLQSLANLGNSYELVRSMRVLPLTRDAAVQLAAITLSRGRREYAAAMCRPTTHGSPA
jgi:hypothetical protein